MTSAVAINTENTRMDRSSAIQTMNTFNIPDKKNEITIIDE